MVSSIYPASANTQLTEMYVDKTSLHLFFIFMGNKYNSLIQKVVEEDNLLKAYKQARKRKRLKNEVLLFKEHLHFNLQQIKNDILNKTYKIGEYRNFKIYHPKERNISALPFRDRVVQHALCNVIEPLFDKSMFSMSYACRKGKGTHKCMLNVKEMTKKFKTSGYFLKMDFSKFFPSVDREILYKEIERKVKDEHVLWLLKQIIPSDGTGLPIGNLTSQLFANVYAGVFDRYIKQTLRVKHYIRYMDDTLILHESKEKLKETKNQLETFSLEKMKLRFSKWYILPIKRGINYVGYRIWPTHVLIRKNSVVQAKRKIKRYLSQNKYDDLQKFIASWSGHIKWSNHHNLSIFIEKNYFSEH